MEFTLDHISITTLKIEETLGFYKKLGFEEESRFDKNGRLLLNLKHPGFKSIIELWYFPDVQEVSHEKNHSDEIKKTQISHIGFNVKDIKEFHSLVVKNFGVNPEIKKGSTVKYYLWIQDPNGIWLEFIER